LANKNPYTDAILSIADEYKSLLASSKNKKNKTPIISHGDKPEDLIRSLLAKKGLDLSEIRRF
tara:strand:- start:66 stop:254 length:189 start_codon:yes stop_codon:yes gene_type:complete